MKVLTIVIRILALLVAYPFAGLAVINTARLTRDMVPACCAQVDVLVAQIVPSNPWYVDTILVAQAISIYTLPAVLMGCVMFAAFHLVFRIAGINLLKRSLQKEVQQPE